MFWRCFVWCLPGLLTGICFGNTVSINEVLSSNGGVLADEDGDFEDWIELYNGGVEAVDLSGWGLSDDYERPFKWIFPEETVIDGGEFLLVWASGKDRSGSELHTGFSIAADGEEILLTRSDGLRVDEFPPVAIPRDVSVGRVPDGVGEWMFFETPTPGATNDTPAASGVLDPPVFSHPSGFYAEGFQLELSAPEGAVVLYTLDGSEPDGNSPATRTYSYKNEYPRATGATELGPLISRTIESREYSGPIAIASRAGEPDQLTSINTRFTAATFAPAQPVFKGTVVRARAVKEGKVSSPTVTKSYFVDPEMASRYPFLVLSLAVDEPDLFGYEEGIYVPGLDADLWRLDHPGTSWNPGRPANYHRRGEDAEAAAHLEVFGNEGALLLAQDFGLRIHGGWSRGNRVKSLRLYARSRYGNDQFDFPFFEGLNKRGPLDQPLSSFRRLILRNSGGFNDWEFTYYRDAFIQSLVAPLPLETQAYRPAIHFVNGEYWGIINIRERQDRHYLSSHFDMDPDDVVILTTPLQQPLEVDTGVPEDLDDFLEVVAYAAANDLEEPLHYKWVDERVDLQNLAQYYALQVYVNNKDFPDNNNDLWRKRTDWDPQAPKGHDGRWRWLLYDFDYGFGGWDFPRTGRALERVVHVPVGSYRRNSVLASPVNQLFRSLTLNSTRFRNQFINQMADQLNSVFVPDRVLALLEQFEEMVAPTRAEHNARWGTALRADPKMADHALNRPGILRDHIIDVFGLQETAELTLENRLPERGKVRVNSLLIDPALPGLQNAQLPYPWSGTYFRDVPVELEALPEEGYRFAGWLREGEQEWFSTDPLIQYTLAGDASIEAAFEEIPLAELPVVVHAWDFEDPEEYLSPSWTFGGGELAVDPGLLTEVVRNGAAQDFPSAHLRVNHPLGAAIVWHLPTAGFESVTVGFETRRSGQGAGLQTIAFTLNGEDWEELETYPVLNAAPQFRHFDFSDVEGVSDNADFALRITFEEGSGGEAGNNRFDNLELKGVPLPGVKLPPVVNDEIVPQRYSLVAGAAVEMDLEDWFADPEGGALDYGANVSVAEVLAVSLDGNVLNLEGLKAGESWVTVTADDGMNPSVAHWFRVLVYPEAHDLSAGPYVFSGWDADAPAGSYPAHMLFLQSDLNDPIIGDPLNFVYQIPPDDAANAEDVEFPYAASNRTRINGLGDEGVAFINTGRGRDVGAALLALDTRGSEAMTVSFTAGTLLPNSRVYALRLQYRTSLEETWRDVLDEHGDPVEYIRNETAGHQRRFGPILLPSELEGLTNLHLQWRYHYLSGDSGPRAQLRLADIHIAAGGSDVISDFSDWVTKHFTAEQIADSGVSAADVSPMRDGVANLMKYALGLSPWERVTEAQLKQGLTEAGELFIRFHRDESKEDLIYVVEVSEDLQEWKTVFDSAQLPAQPNSDGEWHVVVAEPEEGEGRKFLRLEVRLNF